MAERFKGVCSSFVVLVNQFPVKQKFLKVQQFRWHKRNSWLSFFFKSAGGKRLRDKGRILWR